MNQRTWTFIVDHPGERDAGMMPYSDEVDVTVQSGDPGGNDGDFAEAMKEFLGEWFDGAYVSSGLSRKEYLEYRKAQELRDAE